MTQTYNKLVRDKIPEIIERSGKTCRISVLSGTAYIAALEKKLQEEYAEYLESHSLEEMADLLEVLWAIAAYHGFSKEELLAAQEEKRAARGGFDSGIFLQEVETL